MNKPLLRKVHLTLVIAKLNDLQEYVATFENLLSQQRINFASRIEKMASELPEEQLEEFFELYEDDFWRLSKVFPYTLRASLFVTCYSLLEKELIFLCEYFDRAGNYSVKFDNPRWNSVSNLDKAKKYLKAVGINFPDQGKAWQKICQYRQLRNFIVHNNNQLALFGRVIEFGEEAQLSPKQRKLLEIIQSNSELSLEEINWSIQFSDKFCLEVIDTTITFFRELYKAP